ncbi:type II toxin-antitoxin system RelE/ParE family toxin [Thermodesulfobacteriota bacterium]
MNWKIEVKPTAEKYYLKLDKKTRTRMKETLRELENTDDPLLHPSVRALTGKLRGDFRLRVGKWRILFTLHIERKIIYVFAIVPRGDAY